MKQHVTTVHVRSQAAASHLRRQKQIRRLVGKAVTAQLVLAFILSHLDYCNALLEGLPRATIEPLQRVQNAAARLVLNLRLRYRVTPALRNSTGCQFQAELTFRLCLLMRLIYTGRA